MRFGWVSGHQDRRRAKRPDLSRRARRRADEQGFGVVEVIAATVILMLLVVAFSNLLIDSLSAAVVSRQRETAASLASDTIENAKALGQAALTTASTSYTWECSSSQSSLPVFTTTEPAASSGTAGSAPLDGACITVAYTYKVGSTTYSVSSAVSASSSAADVLTVTVTWPIGQSYATTGKIGT